jgi:general secretion pathway protein E
MTTSSIPYPNGTAWLDAAVESSRSAALSGDDLWPQLLQASSLNEASLASELKSRYEIDVLTPEQLADAKPTTNSNSPTSMITVQAEDQSWLLCADPWAPAAVRQLMRSGAHVRLALALPGQLNTMRSRTATSDHKPVQAASTSAAPAVVVVDEAIRKAYADGASDIHFETNRGGLEVKYRLDGVMINGERHDDVQLAESIISRIKVMSQLDITERRRPQDGRIHWEPAGQRPLDLRVSIMPSVFGEDAVLRLLDKAQLRNDKQTLTLESLGFDAAASASIRALASRPHGMLLITGPTGSGKTTTIYAALSEANSGMEKIITIEDPVEYELSGVLQIPVNEQKGLTFATGLRSILRHDPDKILVGEIRDAETAEIAVQSSLTGHLVLTTVHANSLFDVLGRFHHFDIDPFALASALNGIVVQRLLRKTCPHCLQWRPANASENETLSRHALACPAQLPHATGCPECRQTGYRGRFVVAEVHTLDDTLRDLIISRASMAQLRAALYQQASTDLLTSAVACAAKGQTTLEEVSRVIGLA